MVQVMEVIAHTSSWSCTRSCWSRACLLSRRCSAGLPMYPDIVITAGLQPLTPSELRDALESTCLGYPLGWMIEH